MLQEIFRIPTPWGAFPIYGYGLMMVIGFLLAVELAKFLARRRGIDPELFVNAALLALITGIIGARLSHVLENLPEYTRSDRSAAQNLWNMINIRSGGLSFYGGLILAFPVVVAYGIWKKVNIRTGMDIVAPAITLGLAIGRIGCFLNGCCYGVECDPNKVPWAVSFPYQSSAYVDEYYAKKIQPSQELKSISFDGAERLLDKHELMTSAQRVAAAKEHSLWLHPAQLYSTFT